MELTLQEASLLFEVEVDDLYLALEAAGAVTRRLVRDEKGDLKTLYLRSEIEDALSRIAAQALGYQES